MKSNFKLALLVLCLNLMMPFIMPLEVAMSENTQCSPLLNFELKGLDGKPKSLCEYQGKVILAVNTASQCGFTPQYEGLQKLYEEYGEKGLVVLGFPSNEFGGQEPGAAEEIKTFCKRNYGVSFPIFAKSNVKAKGDNPFFKALIEATGTKPRWNFYKYLINREGKAVEAFSSMTKPQSKKLKAKIESLL